jgi:predicted GIY-YIG superfamily endonuclease
MAFFSYFMASERTGTLYVGSTDNLGMRAWKLELIERSNPTWLDMFETLTS